MRKKDYLKPATMVGYAQNSKSRSWLQASAQATRNKEATLQHQRITTQLKTLSTMLRCNPGAMKSKNNKKNDL